MVDAAPKENKAQTEDIKKIDSTQQATTITPPDKIKNPKRVAAGKLVAAKRNEARQQQKEELEALKAEKKLKENSLVDQQQVGIQQLEKKESEGLSTNQLIGLGSLAIGAVGLYFKIYPPAAFSKEKDVTQTFHEQNTIRKLRPRK